MSTVTRDRSLAQPSGGIDDALAAYWDSGPGYLDTANYGLPPVEALDAVQEALELWRTGRSTIEQWIDYCDSARSSFADLMSVDAARIACSSTTSHLVGLVASSLPPGSRVLIPQEEFTSNVFPWFAQASRGVEVTAVPLSELADSVTPDTTLVAFSLVQSANGAVADLAALKAAAQRHGSQILIDITQSCGWMILDATDIDFVVCSTYKWIGAPRGCALMSVLPQRLEALTPNSASWFGGEDIFNSLYGPPLRLAHDARRLDLSPAWVCWAGAKAALGAIEDIGVERIRAHNLDLTETFCARVGLPEPQSPIVSVPLELTPETLRSHSLVAANRGGRLRLSFHAYNSLDDVELAATLIENLTAQ